MSIKRIILFVAIFLVVIAATVTTLYLFNVGKTQTYSRGVKVTDDYVFQKVANVSGLPLFAELPAERSGWKKTTSSSESTYAHAQFTRDNTCTVDITSQLLPNTEKDKKDFQLSQSLVETTARAVDGTASDPYVIAVGSKQGDVDLYSALYNPRLKLVHSTGTTPTNQGGSEKLVGDFTTYIAARVIGSDIAIGQSDTESSVTGGIVSLGAMLPAVIYSYTCSTAQFDVNDALALLGDVTFDFSNTTQVFPATTGK